MGELARLALEPAMFEGRQEIRIPMTRRMLNANFHVGTSESAKALAAFAGRKDEAENLRVEALEELGDWVHPSGRDRVVGLWRPMADRRTRNAATEALHDTLDA